MELIHTVLFFLASSAVVIAAWFSALLIHEGGHVIAGLMVKFRILEIRLGTGPLLFSTNLGHCRLYLHALPVTGWVKASPQEFAWYRIRNMILTAGGPVASAAILLLVVSFPPWISRVDSNLNRLSELFGVMVVCASGYVFLTSLIPRSYKLYGQVVQSDGLQLLRVPFLSEEEMADADGFFAISKICQFIKENDYMCAEQWFRRIWRSQPLGNDFQWSEAMAQVLAETGHTEEARLVYHRILDSDQASLVPSIRRDALDALACLSVYYDRPDLLLESKTLITQALGEFPDSITIKGTMGSILFELGEVEAAVPLLSEVLDASSSPLDCAISGAYLALAAAKKGDRCESKRLVAEISPDMHSHRLVKRLLKAVESLPASSE